MFYKIDDKYYVKLSNYYKEVQYVKGNIIPKKGEESRIYNPNSEIAEISYEDLLEVYKNAKKINIKKDKFNIL